jgi:hypothetical protein
VTRVAQWVQDIVGPPPFEVGDVVLHPSGRKVKIVGGRQWGEHGLSNWWEWREVKKNGRLGRLEQGYGWNPGGIRMESKERAP